LDPVSIALWTGSQYPYGPVLGSGLVAGNRAAH